MRRAGYSIVVAALLGCARQAPVPAASITKVPTDEAERCSLLLEICDVPTPFRSPTKGTEPTPDVIPILLEVASKDLPTIRKAFKSFLGRGHPYSRTAREDLGIMLGEVLWDTPLPRSGSGGAGFRIAVDESGRMLSEGSFPGFRTGIRMEFLPYFELYAKHPGRRDLRPFASQMWSRKKLDETLLHAMRAIPFENGHWKLPAPGRPSKP